ncbi:MAG: right-handed parallel beta-helix repeat-containing protein, partial [bacterium]
MNSQNALRIAAILPILLLSAFFPIACSKEEARIYYVDSFLGNDENTGLTMEAPWASLGKVNSTLLAPGERLLFRSGTRYEGRLCPKGSGEAGSPIVIDRYGDGEKPLIEAEGLLGEALLLENQEYWEVSNLQFTNRGSVREEFRYGVRLRSWNFGTMHYIHLRNLDVHDVNGSLIKKDSGEGHGITWENGGDEKPSRFDDLLIEGCHLYRTDRNGISGYVAYPHGHGEKWFPSLNVVIRNNLLEDIGGDAIKVWGCDGALVDHNTVRGARERCDDYAAGIWPWSSDNTVIQYNEVSGLKGTKDGQAFDTDGYCHNTLFQYNYSHDNDGGFMLICIRDNPGTVIRYNISQNDCARLFHIAGLPEKIEIYNNVFYVGSNIDLKLFLWGGRRDNWPKDVHIFNNIFYVEGTGRNSYALSRKNPDDGTFITKPGFGGAKNVVFENNLLYGNFE